MKTTSALENARKAHERSEELRDAYRQLAADIETRRADLEAAVESSGALERKAAVEAARRQAAGIAGEVETAMEAEVQGVLTRLREDTANDACRRAREILVDSVVPQDHDAAVEQLISDIKAMKLA